jgi:hypothetical protein
MKRLSVMSLLLAIVLGLGAVMTGAQDAARQLRAAMNTEMIDGDLKSAIEQYKKIAAGTDRAIAAQALLRLAECYEKLGDPAASTYYRRLVAEYADLPQGAAARSRLGQLTSGATGLRDNQGMVRTQRWTGTDVDISGTVSYDGRFLSFTDWQTGNLMVRDLSTGRNRSLTTTGRMDAAVEYAD